MLFLFHFQLTTMMTNATSSSNSTSKYTKAGLALAEVTRTVFSFHAAIAIVLPIATATITTSPAFISF